MSEKEHVYNDVVPESQCSHCSWYRQELRTEFCRYASDVGASLKSMSWCFLPMLDLFEADMLWHFDESPGFWTVQWVYVFISEIPVPKDSVMRFAQASNRNDQLSKNYEHVIVTLEASSSASDESETEEAPKQISQLWVCEFHWPNLGIVFMEISG